MPKQPEDGARYNGKDTIFTLAWTTDYALAPDQWFEITIRFMRQGTELGLPVYVQAPEWYINNDLYLQADQETDRAYHWKVRVVRKATDAAGQPTYIPLSPSSGERVFHWW